MSSKAAATINNNKTKPSDAHATLGMVIGPEYKRDAVHSAVEPVVAGCLLRPGTHVGFVGDMNNPKEVGPSANPVGVIDPYLKSDVRPGEWVWMFVYPRTITSLRHVWSHPAIPDEKEIAAAVSSVDPDVAESEAWIKNYARGIGVDYNELLQHAHAKVDNDDYWCEGGRFEGEYTPDDFWEHFEKVTGRSVDENNRGNFFSCSC
jgi:hypothetical protein